MIKRISISDADREGLSSHEYIKQPEIEGINFSNLVVNKPWGYEYLMFNNNEIAIWLLYIKNGSLTSMHCHPNKKTSLLLLSGQAVCSTLNEKFNLNEKQGLIFEKGVFHSTASLSENGIFVIEIETPVDKADLFRLNDKYHRELKGYTNKKNITDKTYNYLYAFIEDKENCEKVFGKYKLLVSIAF